MSTRDRISISIALPISAGIIAVSLPRAQPNWIFIGLASVIAVLATLVARTGKKETRSDRGLAVSVLFFPGLFAIKKFFGPEKDNGWNGALLFAMCIFCFAFTLMLLGLLRREEEG